MDEDEEEEVEEVEAAEVVWDPRYGTAPIDATKGPLYPVLPDTNRQ